MGRAVNLAMEISKFPQMCMKTDRASAYYGAFNAKSFEDALKAEWNRGKPVVEAEAIHGGKIKSPSLLFDHFHFLGTFSSIRLIFCDITGTVFRAHNSVKMLDEVSRL